MRMLFKIVGLVIVLLLILFAVVADMSWGHRLLNGLDLGNYLRLASLVSLVIVGIFLWGHKRRIEASQKYRRADEALAKAEETADRRMKALEATEKRLEDSYADKAKGLDQQIDRATAQYQQRIKVLKEQNLELKETVSKLMRTLKKQRQTNADPARK